MAYLGEELRKALKITCIILGKKCQVQHCTLSQEGKRFHSRFIDVVMRRCTQSEELSKCTSKVSLYNNKIVIITTMEHLGVATLHMRWRLEKIAPRGRSYLKNISHRPFGDHNRLMCRSAVKTTPNLLVYTEPERNVRVQSRVGNELLAQPTRSPLDVTLVFLPW